ncbi:acetyltransferase (GNAT) family protein [Balneicella halophila]|uniref:Acetyltransferase (GNAT) family protein n=1 Tax=Balneicella halophila TaxID=1537566 RepID=A0A7L4UNI9_BALHA|nr:GNAT family N-acetyltransferase [Balneicella halophila]PVX49857.1 acetyltransferase (GNAT) family protein [Balneicella halophila]
MFKTKLFTPDSKPNNEQREEFISFLYEQLEEYGDPKEQIQQCVKYALKETESFGGFVLVGYEDEQICGTVVINKTGMKGYIPENILVYIATHKNIRGKGIGKKLITEVIEKTEGDIALHVEKNNPAIFLYEKVGFTNPYLEMRLKK